MKIRNLTNAALVTLALGGIARAEIHGSDNRAESNNGRVAMLVPASAVSTYAVEGISLAAAPAQPLCAGVPFASQPRTATACSGFMIGPQQMMTAAKCLDLDRDGTISAAESACDGLIALFDHQLDGQFVQRKLQRNALRCTGVRQQGAYDDGIAILDLDRNPERGTLSLFGAPAASELPLSGEEYGVVGHPHGLLKKYDEVIVRSRSGDILRLDADIGPGSAGSPLLMDGIVMGVVIDSDGELVADPANNCFKEATVANGSGNGVRVRAVDGVDAFEPNDTLVQAKERPVWTELLSYDPAMTAFWGGWTNIGPQGSDEDHFVVPVELGDRVEFGINFAHAESDLDFWILNDAGTPIGASRGSTNQEELIFTVTDPAMHTLTLKVESYNNQPANYDLSIGVWPKQEADANGTLSDPVSCGGSTAMQCAAGLLCRPRPVQGRPLQLGETIDLNHAPGVCATSANQAVRLRMETANPYANNTNASWKVFLPYGATYLDLEFTRFGLEQGYDFLEDWPGVGGGLTGNIGPHVRRFVAQPATDGMDQQRVVEPNFKSDHTITGAGAAVSGYEVIQ